MDQFICARAQRDSLRFGSKDKIFTRKIRLDSKGRMLLPADVRRNYGLDKKPEVVIAFDLERDLIFLIIGQDGVMASTGACGAPGPGPTPGPDPAEKEGGEEYG